MPRDMSISSASSASASRSVAVWALGWTDRRPASSVAFDLLPGAFSPATRIAPASSIAKSRAGTPNNKRQANPVKVRVEKQIGSSVLSFESVISPSRPMRPCWLNMARPSSLVRLPPAPGGPASTSSPSTCDYRERTAAAGKFPGGFIKREGRPTMKETLTSRLCDGRFGRLFPKSFKDEVQCQSFVLASDKQNDGDVIAITASPRPCFHLPPALPGTIRQCSRRPHRRPVCRLSDARRAGRERPRSDHVGLRQLGGDDRGLRPRNVGERHVRGDSLRPRRDQGNH